VCSSSNQQEALFQTQGRATTSRGASEAENSAGGAPSAAQLEAAALLYLSTGEATVPVDEVTLGRVTEQITLEGLGLSACGACVGCTAGKDCRLAAIKQAARDGKAGALWAEQGQDLVGRTFEVCQPITLGCRGSTCTHAQHAHMAAK
jgi:hypothetical protein